MAIVSAILREVVKRGQNRSEKKQLDGYQAQQEQLLRLLKKAKNTAFGKAYHFEEILHSESPEDSFNNQVPLFDYESMHASWWNDSLLGKRDIFWPGKVKYFALTSGTSGSPSKRIPVSDDMISAIKKSSLRQMLAMSQMDLPKNFFQKKVLLLGGSTELTRFARGQYEGDLSGILAKKQPQWFKGFSKPGQAIASIKNWDEKLEQMVQYAPSWDIGIITGVPAWVQILLEKIIDRYRLKSIHDIWPNFRIYSHSGVAVGPYRDKLNGLFDAQVYFMESYLASEGYMAFNVLPESQSMRLLLKDGIYFEFIPFNDENFDADGQLKKEARVLPLYEVEENQEYAMLLSTCAGVWRYLIGDTIKFTNVNDFEIIITGRTKHFLSLCGEHLSVDNMTKGIQLTCDELNVSVSEFTVAGLPYENMFEHQWFIGSENEIDTAVFQERLDQHLCKLNDDYATERGEAIKRVVVHQLPLNRFYDFMENIGQKKAQSKFPRVLKGNVLQQWQDFINS